MPSPTTTHYQCFGAPVGSLARAPLLSPALPPLQVPIGSGESGDDDDDAMLGTLDVPLHGHRQETEALI